MAVTYWNPGTRLSRGNIAVGIVPSVANINDPKLSELDAGLGISCAITEFTATSSTDSETIDWLCDPSSESIPGSTTHEMDDLTIKISGQEDQQLIDALKIGQPIFIWRRDGMAHDAALQTGQKVWVWRAIVSSVDPSEAGNAFVGLTCHVTVMARSKTPVAIS